MCALIALGSVGAAPADAALDPLRSVQWALDAIHLGDLGRALSPAPAPAGSGALVAVIDSGVDARHPDLAGRVVAGPDFVDGDRNPDDMHGHGTHIAGLIAASAGNGIGGSGVAPAARILAIRVLDERNSGSAANVAAGIQAAVDAGADVINLSLNWSQPHAALAPVVDAMRRAADAGVAVIVAAGNDALGHCEEPVLPQRALCIGAIDNDLALASFSSHGSGLGLVAPGESIMSTWRGGDYAGLSGTSQSAAVTSGVAALLAGLGLGGPQIIERLVRSARDIGAPGPDERFGFGLLDADRAVDGALEGRLAPMLRINAAQRARRDVVRTRGLRVSCDAALAGTCRVRLRVGQTTVAQARTRVDGSGSFAVLARPTHAGRKLLARQRTRTLEGVIEAGLSGVPGARRAVVLGAR